MTGGGPDDACGRPDCTNKAIVVLEIREDPSRYRDQKLIERTAMCAEHMEEWGRTTNVPHGQVAKFIPIRRDDPAGPPG